MSDSLESVPTIESSAVNSGPSDPVAPDPSGIPQTPPPHTDDPALQAGPQLVQQSADTATQAGPQTVVERQEVRHETG